MGRASVFMVLGLAWTLSVMGPSVARYSNDAYENYINYYEQSQVHNIAASGANIGTNEVFRVPTWNAGYTSIPYSGGWYTVTAKHLTLPKDTSRIMITSIGKFVSWKSNADTLRDTVWVMLEPSSFAKFAVYLKTMSTASWATGDTVFGPCHIDATLKYSGNPVFWGKTTTLTGKSGTGSPQFKGGYQSGVSVPLPLSLAKSETAASVGGKIYTAPSGSGQFEMVITLNNDSTMNYSRWRGTTKADTFSNIKIPTVAPNGVVWVKDGNIRIKGTYKGQYTFIASGTGTNGDAFIAGDIKAATNPQTGSSKDLFGLVVDNDITVPLPPGYSNGSPAPKHDYLLQAALFCRTGQFVATLESHMGVQGAVNVYGSLTSYNIGAFGHFNNGVMDYGYQNHFWFDTRFYTAAPPFYPNSGTYQAIAWKE
jgi:hypothetical protein